MARQSSPHVFTRDLGQKLAVGNIAVKAHLVVFDFRLSGRHRRIGRRTWRREAGDRLRRRCQRDLPRGLCQGCTHFVGAEVRLSSNEVSAALAQAAGQIPLAAAAQAVPGLSSPGTSPDAAVAPGQPEVKDYQVSFDGDVAHGQFLTQIAGKNVWVTLSGHLGSKDGYATFDPSEFKVGDLNIPVSLVNDALQKKLIEQRDRLKLPDNVGGMKVENGELVMTQK